MCLRLLVLLDHLSRGPHNCYCCQCQMCCTTAARQQSGVILIVSAITVLLQASLAGAVQCSMEKQTCRAGTLHSRCVCGWKSMLPVVSGFNIPVSHKIRTIMSHAMTQVLCALYTSTWSTTTVEFEAHTTPLQHSNVLNQQCTALVRCRDARQASAQGSVLLRSAAILCTVHP